MNRIYFNRRTLSLTAVMVVVSLVISSFAVISIYNNAREDTFNRLTDIVNLRKAELEILQNNYNFTEKDIYNYLSVLDQKDLKLGNSGELVIAFEDADSIEFLIINKAEDERFRIKKDAPIAIPMQRALHGEKGVVKNVDYDGIEVFSAYSFVENLRLGIVAKIPVSEINSHYIRASIIIFISSLVLLALSFLLFIRILNPVFKKLQEDKNQLTLANRELLQSQALILESETKFKELFSRVNDAIFIYNPETFEIIEANEATSELYGYSQSELIGMSCLVFSAEVENSKQVAKQAVENGRAMVNVRHHRRKDGKDLYVQLSAYKIKVNSKDVMISVVHDITDLIRAEKELTKAKEKAEESDRLKSAFLANMSHEIRTPMNAVIGFASLLEKESLGEEKRAQYLKQIQSGGKRLLALISDIVDVSKIDAKQIRLSMTVCNLNEIVTGLVRQFSVISNKPDVVLKTKMALSDKDSYILSDTTRLSQIISNLIENALKFTAKGEIELGYAPKDGFLEFYVRDTGVGIEKKDQDIIFDRFRQAENEKSGSVSGTGLGLAISKGLANLFGGEIWVNSQPGKGATFYFTIPWIKAMNVESEHKIQSEVEKKTGVTILIAEDEESNYYYLQEILEDFGYSLIRATNGKEAIEIVESNAFIDLILMDLKMPLMNGLEATREIRKSNKTLPIIACTAYAMSEDSEVALQSGCNDYIAKPVSYETIVEVLKKYITRN